MSASNQAMQVASHNNNLVMIQPTNFAELDRYCTLIARSSFCPKAFAGKPGDVMVALQMGAEVGLSPMQAIQNIAVINGKPCLWGDGALAVVISSPNYQYHREWFTGGINDETLTAHCAIKRKGSDEYIYSFSTQDAKKAGLWNKPGVWQQYPSRMLQNRARGFAIRDKFADALRGINIREEVEDYVKVKDVTPNKEKHKQASENQKLLNEPISVDIADADNLSIQFMEFMADLSKADTMENLQEVFAVIKKIDFKARPDLLKKLVDQKDKRKGEIYQASIQAVKEGEEECIDVETGEVQTEEKE